MNNIFYKSVRSILHVLAYVLYRPEVIGLENLDVDGPIVLAGTHTSQMDPPVLIGVVKNRELHYLAKIELFKGIMKPIVKGMGCIPVDRKVHNGSSLIAAIDTLNNGKDIAIFPEGTINRGDGLILPFKLGAVKMANASGAVLVPFVITGKYKLFRKGLRIEFLEPRIITDDFEEENKKLEEDICKVIKKHR